MLIVEDEAELLRRGSRQAQASNGCCDKYSAGHATMFSTVPRNLPWWFVYVPFAACGDAALASAGLGAEQPQQQIAHAHRAIQSDSTFMAMCLPITNVC